MDLSALPLFVVAGLLLNLTPGPDVLYIVSSALRDGARAGMVAAMGITAGVFVHIFAAAVGLSALLVASQGAFTLLTWAGAAYLVLMGVKLLWGSQRSAIELKAPYAVSTGVVAQLDYKKVFFQGFWTNALNAKVALFFLAFLPQFIAPEVPDKPLAFFLWGLLFNFNSMWVNLGWALGAARLSSRVSKVGSALAWLDRVAGALFITFGLKLALSDLSRS